MAKKEKAKKPEEPEAEKPAAAEGEEGAAPKKKLAGKTLVLFIILPAILVLGGGGLFAELAHHQLLGLETGSGHVGEVVRGHVHPLLQHLLRGQADHE